MELANAPIPTTVHLMIASHSYAQKNAVADARAWPASGDAGRIAEMLRLVADRLSIRRRIMQAGETVYGAGERFAHLWVVNSGCFKIVNTSADGRNQVVGLQFRGDWLGCDGIAMGRYGCDAVALDTSEVWALRYDALLQAGTAHPPLLAGLHTEMSRAITHSRDSMVSLCTLPVAARVANFLLYWVESLSGRGQRTDQITLRMTRAEIGNYLGMTLESVSRAFSRLARNKLIRFPERGRRDILIPDLRALDEFIQENSNLTGTTVKCAR